MSSISWIPAGPPLGLGGLPFETTEITLPEGSLLALHTDGAGRLPGTGPRRGNRAPVQRPRPSRVVRSASSGRSLSRRARHRATRAPSRRHRLLIARAQGTQAGHRAARCVECVGGVLRHGAFSA
nr:SpoIIE family protein phosphatase [Streptomyces graminofaciens]